MTAGNKEARLRQGFRLRRGYGGQAGAQPPTKCRGAAGYVLLAITIILVIMGIFMGAAVPLWQHVMTREREEELIWRGKQYVQAIELYQKKHPGAYPPKLDILVEQKFLRKLYKDPMTKDGEWKILRQLSPEIRAMMRPGRGRRARGTEPGQRSRALTRSSRARQRGSEQGLGGIVGVVSKSEEESIRLLDGKDHYNEWLFVYMEQVRGTRRPGMPQRGRPGRQRGPGAGRRPPSKRSPTK